MRCRFPLLRTRTLPGHALCHFMTASLLSSHSCVGVQSLRFFVDSASLMFYCFSCWVMIFGNEFIMMMLQGGSRSYHSQILFFILGKSCKYESFDKIQQVHCIGICEMTIFFVLTSGKRITSNFYRGGVLQNTCFTFLENEYFKIFKEHFHLWYIRFHPKKMK